MIHKFRKKIITVRKQNFLTENPILEFCQSFWFQFLWHFIVCQKLFISCLAQLIFNTYHSNCLSDGYFLYYQSRNQCFNSYQNKTTTHDFISFSDYYHFHYYPIFWTKLDNSCMGRKFKLKFWILSSISFDILIH